jgi:hypothetical protein
MDRSPVSDRRRRFVDIQYCPIFSLVAKQGSKGPLLCSMQSRLAMAPILTVELYTPGEIVDSRRSYTAETAKGALLAAKAWLADGNHTATRLRVLDDSGTVVFDQPVILFVDGKSAKPTALALDEARLFPRSPPR